MKKKFRTLPKRIAAAFLTAGLIVSSSNLEYVRFVLPNIENVSQVEAAELTTDIIKDENLLKAMKVYVGYLNESPSYKPEDLAGKDLVNGEPYKKYHTMTITKEDAGKINCDIDLSGCSGIKVLTGISEFNRIKSINISNFSGSVISDHAFENCKELTKVIIPNTVTSVGDYAFNGCTSLNTIEVKDDTHNEEDKLNLYYIDKIGDSSFAAAKGFTGVVFDYTKIELAIGSSAFNTCEGLKYINIPTEDYNYLGQGVFKNCFNLEEVKLNNNLKAIPTSFFDSTDMSKMDNFPEALEKIGKDAFASSLLLTPDFSNCHNLKLIDQGAFQCVEYTYNEKTDNTFILPNEFSGDGNLKTGDSGTGIRRIAFYNSSLEKIIIPDGITEIQDSVFEGCNMLIDVKFGANSKLTKIDEWSFRKCQQLPNTDFLKDLPALKEIGSNAFSECYWLEWEYVDNGDGTKTYAPKKDAYGTYTIGGGIENIKLPESLEVIGSYAFANNYGLKTITMGNNVKKISDYAFAIQADTKHEGMGNEWISKVSNSEDPFNDQKLLAYSASLTDVNLSKSLIDIGECAFKTNTKLSTVTFNGAVKREGVLELPSSVKNIGNNAFSDCVRWQFDIDADEDGVINSNDYKLYGLSSIDLSNLVLDTFGEGVFENDCMLESAILPKTLKTIPSNLFRITDYEYKVIKEGEKPDVKITKLPGVRNVTFPDDIEVIGESAFEGCTNFIYKGEIYEETINKVTVKYDKLPETLKTIENKAFMGCYSIGKVAMNENLISIGEEAFRNCSVLDLNTDESPIKSFEDGYGLTKVNFANAKKLESIGKGAFKQTCIDKADLFSNKSLELIQDELFADCFCLKETMLPENVTKVGSKVYANNYIIKSVQLPAIAEVSADIFDGISPTHIEYNISYTLSARSVDKLVKVPLRQKIKLNFIKVVSQNTQYSHNNYKITQKVKDSDTNEKFIEAETERFDEDVYLTGTKETGDNTTFEIENMVTFETYYNNKLQPAKPKLFRDFDLTVSEVYAEELSIVEPKEKIQVTEDGSKILSLSISDTNPIEITANVLEPLKVSKSPVWSSDSNKVIAVENLEDDLETVNNDHRSIAKIQVKGGGTAKLTVSNGLTGEKEVKDEVTVKVIYPVDPYTTTVNIGSLDSNADSFKLEEGTTDTISVVPGYSDEASKADSNSKAKIYYVSDNEEVATVDRNNGTITANASGDAVISIYDETGNLIKNINLNVVKNNELTPNIIKISKERIDIYKDQNSDKITAKVYPDKDYLQGVTWSIENEEYATVTNNTDGSATVNGKALGETRLIAKSKIKDDVVASIPVNVSVPVTTFKFQKSSAQVAVDDILNIGMTNEQNESLALLYEPAEASNNAVTWKIVDGSIAKLVDASDKITLYNGIPTIMGIKQGTTKLTATTANGKTASIDINVYQPLTDFSVEESKTLHNGDTFKLNVVKTPTDSSEGLTYSSSNEEVATVDAEGNVKAIAEGQASIYVTRLSNSEYKACDVTVIEKVNAISILDAPIEISVEGTYTIGKAADGDDVKVGYRLNPNSSDLPTWSSSNPEIASVQSESGNVTIKGVAPGTATITATMSSGATTTITVNVVSLSTELKFTEERKTVAVGTQTSVSLIKTPENTTEGIEFTSSDETIAKVDQNGVVTGIAKGEVTITAKGKISGVSAGITITVTVPSTGVKIVTEYASEKKIYLVKGSSYQLQYKLLPEETTDKVSFTTNKKKIANVSEDGTISAKKKGNATITVKTESGKKATIKVYVVSKEKNAKKIKIKTSSIKVGKTVKLKYSITPTTTTNTFSYSVNKPKIAEIDEYGYITGLKKGKVKVTVTASNGKKKTKTIKVK